MSHSFYNRTSNMFEYPSHSPARAWKYSDYKPEGYSMPYSLMPVEGQGVYIDGTETEYKDVWTTGDARIRDKNAYMAEMAKRQAAAQSVQNTQAAETWIGNNLNKLQPGYINPDTKIPAIPSIERAKLDKLMNTGNEPMFDRNGLAAYLFRGGRGYEEGLRNHQQNADNSRAFFNLKRENGTYNSDQ